MRYEEWETSVPKVITTDSLWKVKAYRLALFLSDLGWHDVTKLMQDRRTWALSNQLYRAVGSIGANIAEGYGRYHYQENIQFCRQARGSLYELIDHIVVALECEYINNNHAEKLIEEAKTDIKILNGYIRYLKSRKENE